MRITVSHLKKKGSAFWGGLGLVCCSFCSVSTGSQVSYPLFRTEPDFLCTMNRTLAFSQASCRTSSTFLTQIAGRRLEAQSSGIVRMEKKMSIKVHLSISWASSSNLSAQNSDSLLEKGSCCTTVQQAVSRLVAAHLWAEARVPTAWAVSTHGPAETPSFSTSVPLKRQYGPLSPCTASVSLASHVSVTES